MTLAFCCGKYHRGEPAPSAEALMRSRYSAYVLGLADYLLATWHPETRPPTMDLADGPKWLGLTVIATRQGLQDFGQVAALTEPMSFATVEFFARYKVGGRAHRMHEISRFEQIDGRWCYLDGEQLP
jgi:SEC-C motif-containing protein